MRMSRSAALALAAAVCLAASPGLAAAPAPKAGTKPINLTPPPCNGTFSNGVKTNVQTAIYMPDAGYITNAKPPTPVITAAKQTVCDVHTFAWNQFLYYTQSDPKTPTVPRFLQLAPWYNALTVGPKPGNYPGGPTDLRTAMLDQSQAGTDGHLLDMQNGLTVRYDIRFDPYMYASIVDQNYYTEALFKTACNPDPSNGNNCKNNDKIWMIPSGANEHPEPGSTEVKTAWRDFGLPTACPSAQYFCDGRFGLVGFHLVMKTFSHGEWIWASFEHVANDPDCAPGGDTPIAANSPLGTPWSFFSAKSLPPSVLSSKTCNITSSPPQCNANPNPSGDKKTWTPVNVCRTDVVAAGGASPTNCAVNGQSNQGNVACLNATIMPQLSGVWKNYKMVGSVWVSGGMGPNQDFRIQIFQTQVPGLPYPAPSGFTHLADTTMETWLQTGSTGYDPFKTNATQAGCFLCHNEPSGFGPGNRQADLSHFPGKLPLLKLQQLKASLIPANSTMKAPK
jgi:hypothetical protein